MRLKALTITLLLCAVPLTGCATVKGAGRDIESVGKAGQEVIDGD